MRHYTQLILVAVLALGLAHCGQKGGLTRPEQAGFVGTVQ